MDVNKNQLPRRNPLDVASLTTPLGQSHESSSSSSSGSSSSSIRPASNLEASQQQQGPNSRSAPFTCASVEETLRSHGASMPTRSPRFRFQMRQEPKHGLAVGNDSSAYKNARVIPLDPMPICEMIPEMNEDGQFLSLPEVSVQARLVNNDYPYQEMTSENSALEPLINGVQESGFIAPIAARHEECLFVFPELGVRRAGQYRIRFDLIDRIGLVFKRVASIYSHTFKIVSDKKSFPGMTPSSDLVRQLVRRGLKLRVIKDPQDSKRASTSSSSQLKTAPNKKQRGSFDNLSDYKSSASPGEESVRIARPPERSPVNLDRPQSQSLPMSQSQPIYQSQPKHHLQTTASSMPIEGPLRKLNPPQFLQSSNRSSSYTTPRDAPFQASPHRILSPFGNPNQRRDGEQTAELSRRSGWLRRDLPLPYPPDPLSRSNMSMMSSTPATATTSSPPKSQVESSSTTSDSSISTPSYPSIDRSHITSQPIRNTYAASQSPSKFPSRALEDTKMSSLSESAPFYPSMRSFSSEGSSSGERQASDSHPGDPSKGVKLPPISSFQTKLPSMRHPEQSPPDQHQRYHR